MIHLPGFPEFMWYSQQGSDYSELPPLVSLAHQYCQCTHYDARLLVRLVGLFLNRSLFFFLSILKCMEVRRHLTVADSLLLLRGTQRISQVLSA